MHGPVGEFVANLHTHMIVHVVAIMDSTRICIHVLYSKYNLEMVQTYCDIRIVYNRMHYVVNI